MTGEAEATLEIFPATALPIGGGLGGCVAGQMAGAPSVSLGASLAVARS